jgi:uncharacterized membrane protein
MADIPGDGPDAALVRLVRHHGLRYSREFVNRSLLEHSQPSSLLALVEVAPKVGLKPTAARAEPEALDDLAVPSVVHFVAGSTGGFGVLESTTPEGLVVWDSVNGSRVVPRDTFVKHWSGVVVMVEPDRENAVPERGYLFRRLTEMMIGRVSSPSVIGGPGATGLRVSLAALIAVLLAFAVSEVPSDDRLAAASLIVLTILGAATSIVAAVSVGDARKPFAARICKRGKLIDCESVLTSPYSRIYGFPLSHFGIAFFGALLLTVAIGGSVGAPVWFGVRIAYLLTIPAALVLVGLQVVMRQLCTLCLTVHTVNVASVMIATTMLADYGWGGRTALVSIIAIASLAALLLLLVIPYALNGAELDAYARTQRQMMASPLASAAQVLTVPPLSDPPTACALTLNESGEHELVAFVHPGCSRCSVLVEEIPALVATGRVKVRLALAPKKDDAADLRLCAAVYAAGLALGPSAMLDAYRVAKRHFEKSSSDDPLAVVAVELGADASVLDAQRNVANSLAERAETFANRHLEGTPALFVDGRPFRGPTEHLLVLLERYPDVLAPVASTRA